MAGAPEESGRRSAKARIRGALPAPDRIVRASESHAAYGLSMPRWRRTS
jgi:hypothetical protein